MSPPLVTYRVSRRFLWSLWRQAVFGSLGVIVSWTLFVWVSESLLPTPGFTSLTSDAMHPGELRFWLQPHQHREREVLRFFVGPALALAVWFGGLVDFVSWVAVKYEVHPDRLVMRWRFWSREIAWDVMRSVDERSQAAEELRSLLISAVGLPPILVRGLERMTEFVETARARLSPLTRWTIVPVAFDMTSGRTNFVIGALLPIPLHVTWLLGYVAHWSESTIMLLWSLVLAPVALGVWWGRPLSRCHSCAREVELLMAALLLLLSGLLTFVRWIDSPFGDWLLNRLL